MQREFNITPLLINHQSQPSKNSWVKIFIYEPAEPEVIQARGTMYAVLSLSTKSNVDFAAIMQMILEQLHSQYFQQTSGGILQVLESTLDGIHQKLILMGQKDKKLAEDFSFNLLTAVSWGTVLYFGQLGTSRAALYRDGKLFDIDEGAQKTTNLYLSSGVLKTNDKVILGTSQLFKRFNKTQLKQILAKPNDKIITALENELDPGPARQEQSGIVLAVDIKHVPSPKDEAFTIHDPSRTSSNRSGNIFESILSLINPATYIGGLAAIFTGIGNALRWKLFGVIPVLPILLAIIASAALLYSLFGGEIWQPQPDLNQELVQSATESLRQAEEVVVINPDRAYDLLGNAKEYINQGLETHPDNPQLADLQDRYNQLLRQILVSSELTPVVVAEVSLSPTQPTLALSEDTLYAVDGNQQAIISISEFGQVATFTKDSRITPQSLLTATNSGLIMANQGQVFPVSSAGLGQPGDMPANSSAIAMAHFESNGYTLGQDGQIYRIPRTESAISPISRYFTQPVSNTGLVDLAVDGYIYILRQDGTLERYLNGVKQPLALERSTLAKGAEAVFTPVQSQSLYLLKDNALIAWEKEGKYIGQYTLAEAGEWLMATVNDSGDTLYVLSTDSKLYSATLPQ